MFQTTFSTLATAFSSPRTTLSLPSDGQVLPGAQPHFDPFLLNFATAAYGIESQTLRIPERFTWAPDLLASESDSGIAASNENFGHLFGNGCCAGGHAVLVHC
ncbi:hypothetical protein GRF29_69g166710 [Pseudopithomyces chartarum]|uniref:Uncharacterized protein n=1 Tax=Pseudopithomyces chartarum TaxID=1892770 RepID=A0AAN6M0D2_9PLEO|nr:hypothetical protein GRF29_69g166710 [Pseudopithomyces chartarum]